MAKTLDRFIDRQWRLESNDARPSLCRFKNLDFEMGTHVNSASGLELSTRMNHCLVLVVAQCLQKQQLGRRAGVTCSQEPSVKYTSRVENDRVARRNEIDEIAECSVIDGSAFTIHNHQPALVTPLGWSLCYLIGREMKVIVIG